MTKLKFYISFLFMTIMLATPMTVSASSVDLFDNLDVVDDAEVIDITKAVPKTKSSAKGKSAIDVSASSYDPRQTDKVTSIKDQGELGLCWDYAANSAAESNLILKGSDSSIDLSEIYYAYYYYKAKIFEQIYSDYTDTGFIDFCNHGGWSANDDFANVGEYIDRFALESDYPMPETVTNEYTLSDEQLDEFAYKLAKVYRLADYDGEEEDIAYTKQILSLCGNALICEVMENNPKYYTYPADTESDAAYYYYILNPANHAMEIVGWDDNYSKENFKGKKTPKEDGAWLVKNSWGSGSEINGSGYIWISYYDRGIYNIVRGIEVVSKESYTPERINCSCNIGDVIDLVSLCEENNFDNVEYLYDTTAHEYVTGAQYTNGGTYTYRMLDKDHNLLGFVDVTVNYTNIKHTAYINDVVDLITETDADYAREIIDERESSQGITSIKYNDYGYHKFNLYKNGYVIGYYELLIVPTIDAKLNVTFSNANNNEQEDFILDDDNITLMTPDVSNYNIKFDISYENIDITNNQNVEITFTPLDEKNDPFVPHDENYRYLNHTDNGSLNYNLTITYNIPYSIDTTSLSDEIIKSVSKTYHVSVIPIASSLTFVGSDNNVKEQYYYFKLNNTVNIADYVCIVPSNEEYTIARDENSDEIISEGVITAYGEEIYTITSVTNKKLSPLKIHICALNCSKLEWKDETSTTKNITLNLDEEYDFSNTYTFYPYDETFSYELSYVDDANTFTMTKEGVICGTNHKDGNKATILIKSDSNPEKVLTLNVTVKEEEHSFTPHTVAPTLTEDGYVEEKCSCGKTRNRQTIPSIKATVVRVVDGDTIVVNTNGTDYKVRFIGVNTPESVSQDESKNTEEGVIASNYLKTLLQTGSTIFLEYDETYFDVYGRILAYPWLVDYTNFTDVTDSLFNEYNLGALLLQNTYCESVYYSPNGKYKDRYDNLEELYQPFGTTTDTNTEPDENDVTETNESNNSETTEPSTETNAEVTEPDTSTESEGATEVTEPDAVTKPEGATETTEPDTSTESEGATETTEPEDAAETAEPADTTEDTEPDDATKPEDTTEVTEPDNITKPEDTTEVTEPDNITKPEDTTEVTEPDTSTEPEDTTEVTEPDNITEPDTDSDDTTTSNDTVEPDIPTEADNTTDTITEIDETSSVVEESSKSPDTEVSKTTDIKVPVSDPVDVVKTIVSPIVAAATPTVAQIVPATNEDVQLSTKISSIKAKGKSLKIRYKKLSSATKYQIEISNKPTFKNRKKYTTAKSSMTIKVKKKGKYYVRVKAIIKGQRTSYSKVKSIKVK